MVMTDRYADLFLTCLLLIGFLLLSSLTAIAINPSLGNYFMDYLQSDKNKK